KQPATRRCVFLPCLPAVWVGDGPTGPAAAATATAEDPDASGRRPRADGTGSGDRIRRHRLQGRLLRLPGRARSRGDSRRPGELRVCDHQRRVHLNPLWEFLTLPAGPGPGAADRASTKPYWTEPPQVLVTSSATCPMIASIPASMSVGRASLAPCISS